MSGPKDYSPPPRYSIQVFDGKLNEVFQLQSELKQLVEELKNANVRLCPSHKVQLSRIIKID